MASRPRAYWKGYLRLSLVSIGVELFAGTSAGHRSPLHQIHKPSGKRIRYEKVVPGLGPIETADIVKGVEVDDDTYVLLEPDELDAIKLESKRTIDLVQFTDYCDVDPRYYERPYYLLPEGDVSGEGYYVIRAALAEAKKVGIGQMTMRGRESLVAVKPCGPGLLLETLRYADEVRAADSIFGELKEPKLDKEMVSLASELIARKSKPFEPEAFKDHYASALRELIDEKRKGHTITVEDDETREPRGKVIDLMAALKRSVEQGGKGKAGRSRASSRARGKPAKRRA